MKTPETRPETGPETAKWMSEPLTCGSGGTIIDGEHRLAVRVYFEDTDTARMVYHANYLKYMERARTEILRLCGVSQRDMLAAQGDEKKGFAVRRCEIDFLAPARLDDLLEVRSRLEGMGAAYIDIKQQVVREGAVLADAFIRVACVGAKGQPVRIPADIASEFKALMGNQSERGAA